MLPHLYHSIHVDVAHGGVSHAKDLGTLGLCYRDQNGIVLMC